ncbi:hypothetical protein EDD32_1926 [Georgenia muralis]|uniref:Uncharacterized protein n=2 Tax=Georgenia muralis TaxID=154117 RepID=A0A3N5A294_9MICO|nr:hypothetical protein EDD32_1926 [Georgenia muralis]
MVLMGSDPLLPAATEWFGLATLAVVVLPALLGLLITYWIIRLAVKHGILAADKARARTFGAGRDWDRGRP